MEARRGTTMAEQPKKFYVVYDHRAFLDPDAAIVLGAADTLEEAKRDAKPFGLGAACVYEYDDVGDNKLENGRLVWPLQ